MLAKITTFGGIFPALKPRALPADAAQVAHNLLASVPDFRPLLTDLAVATVGVSNPVSMYRLDRVLGGAFNTDMSTGWKVNSIRVSYAKGPLNSDASERTYYSYDDGSAPPRWLDLAGLDRELGVPQPTVPTAEVVVTDEFSTEERATGVESVLQTIATTIRAHLLPKWRGATNPGLGTTGYINVQNVTDAEPRQAQMARVYRLTSTGGTFDGTLANSYTALGADNFSHIFDATLGGVMVTTNGDWPAWSGQGPDHIGFAFSAYGLTYDIDAAGLKTALEAIDVPGGEAGAKLMDADTSQAIVDKLVALLDTTTTEPAAKLSALERAVLELKALFDGGLSGATAATTAAFYASGTTTTTINNEVDTWANKIFDMADRAFKTSVTLDNLSPGDSGP